MDALSLAASVIAVVQISGRLIKLCKDYMEAIQDVPADLRTMLVEISTLKGLFDSLHILIDTVTLSQDSDSLQAPVNACRQVLSDLEELLDSKGIQGLSSNGARTSMSTAWAALAWPRKKSRAKTMMGQLDIYRSTINLVLTADIANEIKALRVQVETLDDKLSSSERQDILKWLVRVDSTSNHNFALQLHESGTSDWVFQTDQWRYWLTGGKRLLWIYGIPGAGKTILASYLIETIKERCRKSTTILPEAAAFHYCFHARSDGDERTKCISSLIAQLCRQLQHIPPFLKTAHQHNSATLGDLMQVFNQIVLRFETVHIVIDALDEAGERGRFLTLIHSLVSSSRYTNVRVLVTSRDEIDIRRTLEPISSHISMSNPVVDDDIRRHVHSELHSDPKFLRWPPALLDQVENALIKGAKGMFRWAHCQLLILRKLNQQRAVKRALSELPETLDETYERILCSIPDESKPLAFRALAILCSDMKHPGPLTANLVRDAVLWGDAEHEDMSSNPDDELFDIEALHEVCICLITVHHFPDTYQSRYDKPIYSGKPIVLAHYTVKEFLVSGRIKVSPASYFQLTTAQARLEHVRPLLLAALHGNYDAGQSSDVANEFPKFASGALPGILLEIDQDVANDHRTLSLLTDLLNPRSFPVSAWRTQFSGIQTEDDAFVTRSELRSASSSLPVSTIGATDMRSLPCDDRAIIAAKMMALQLEKTSLAYLDLLYRTTPDGIPPVLSARVTFDCFPNCTILDIAAASTSEAVCRYLIEKGASIRDATKALIHACSFHGKDLPSGALVPLIKYLLEQGAEPNTRVGPLTPLKAAVCVGDIANVIALLEGGADPDGAGDGAYRGVSVRQSCWMDLSVHAYDASRTPRTMPSYGRMSEANEEEIMLILDRYSKLVS
ncbi:hypothetical protein B0T26DRAFT_192499 [Lasiosphaeria miniovina]|uniref:NACHT domain-containing protein n=1 Tax=Lasiosphaeria miniovina TaxID=1954250 RepID=A0AA40ATJ7_9PEZI|nr:uncharacterized protein B0T26DRAFT_192499 [Lasiosphaeria miniovina]KAK0721765.1 hypothetical protein B0T26DRAFT_192499 [Lasiosphaeria miniovina]